MTHEETETAVARLESLKLYGDSNENLSEICMVIYSPMFGWNSGACETLRDMLIELLRQADHDTHIELPKDSDGEYIHVGDELDGYGKTIKVVELRIGRSGWVIVSRDGNAYADTYAFVHHHKPTMEELMREYADKTLNEFHEPTLGRITSEYAERIREAMKEEQ